MRTVPRNVNVLFLFCVACAPRLPSATVAAHPLLSADAPRTEVLEQSHPERPAWVRRVPPPEGAFLMFRGMGAATELKAAQAAARRDLSAAANRYAGVRVKSALTQVDTNDTSSAHESVRSVGLADRVAVKERSTYHERVRVGDGAPKWFVYVIGTVARAEIARVRSAAKIVTPPNAFLTVTTNGDLGRAVERELVRRLDVGDRQVRAGSGDGAPVVRVEVLSKGSGYEAKWTLEKRGGAVSHESLFELEDELVEAIAAAIGAES